MAAAAAARVPIVIAVIPTYNCGSPHSTATRHKISGSGAHLGPFSGTYKGIEAVAVDAIGARVANKIAERLIAVTVAVNARMAGVVAGDDDALVCALGGELVGDWTDVLVAIQARHCVGESVGRLVHSGRRIQREYRTQVHHYRD